MGGEAIRLACDPVPAPCPCKDGPCGYAHFRPGHMVDLAAFDRLAAECPRKASLGMHENGQYVHVALGRDPACSGAYLAAQMVREGAWSYSRLQLEAFAQRAELRRAGWHGLPMPSGLCIVCRPVPAAAANTVNGCACGGACFYCHDCPGCTLPA